MKRFFIAMLALCTAMPAAADCVFRQSTASQTFLIGPFLDGTDGITAETALTVANTDIRISKNGANTVAKNSGSCTHDEAGMYACTFDATDTSTAGTLQIYTDNSIGATSVVPVFHECLVVAADYFDLMDGTTALMTSRQAGNMLETTIASVTSQVQFVLTNGASNDDAYNETTVEVVGGTEECNRYVTNYVGSTKTLSLDLTCPFTVAAGDTIRLHIGASGSGLREVNNIVSALNDLSSTQVGLEVDSSLATVGLDQLVVLTSTADSGTTSTIVDSMLSQTDNYWIDEYAAVVSFAGGHEARCITGFTAATDTLTVAPAFNNAVGTEKFNIVSAPACQITAQKIAPSAIGASEIAANALGASEIGPDAIGASELATDAVNEIWTASCEDQGGGYSCQEAVSLLLAEAMGTCTYTPGTRTFVCNDPSGTEVRFTLVYGAALNGDRSSSTPTPFTP